MADSTSSDEYDDSSDSKTETESEMEITNERDASQGAGPSNSTRPQTEKPVKTRKRVRNVTEWKKQIRKRQRNAGGEYTSSSNKKVSILYVFIIAIGIYNIYIRIYTCTWTSNLEGGVKSIYYVGFCERN